MWFLFCGAEEAPKALHILGKCFITELHPSLASFFLKGLVNGARKRLVENWLSVSQVKAEGRGRRIMGDCHKYLSPGLSEMGLDCCP